ncbi:acyltransferase family protein [Cellulomonas sp. PSBB021]|uniref:acyltransferase family protein n=1 Tax=Cellulomonas sp. PSBB021 TaxID=2003551 RepID=UPI0012FDBFF6|nr:acyltransferase family protein [Cellulomonas sp. PSBB021]
MQFPSILRPRRSSLRDAASSQRRSPDGFRLDIQGLRAFAVLAVIADHALGWPSGGFIGVDVFFVISGFLITGLLLREFERTGSISFVQFYARRARRILPAALVVLIVTIAAAVALFPEARARNVAGDAFWSSVFLSNWHFADQGTDYFQQGLATSPLQHFWSLSVEEQFYFVWPWLLLGVCALVGAARLKRWSARRVAVVLISVISLGSLAWAMSASHDNPTDAYFSTSTRVWELGAGALLAALTTRLTAVQRLPRRSLQAFGLTGLVLSLFVIDPSRQFPGPWAILPVLSTSALIVAGMQGPGPRVLQTPAVVYVGTISYSLYLWHFPVIIFIEALRPDPSIIRTVGILVAAGLLAVVSYHLVEKPVLDSPLLLRGTGDRRAQWRAWRHKVAAGTRPGLAAAAAFGIIAIIATVGQVDASRSYTPPPVALAEDAAPVADSTTPVQDERSQFIAAALSAREWPDLSPAIDELNADAKAKQWVEDGCLGGERGSLPDVWENADRCAYGSGPKSAVLLGDSVAISYAPALVEALSPQDWTIRIVALQQCPAAAVAVQVNGADYPACDEFHSGLAGYLERLDPDVIIASQADNTLPRLSSGATGVEAVEELSSGLVNTIESLGQLRSSWVLLTAPP